MRSACCKQAWWAYLTRPAHTEKACISLRHCICVESLATEIPFELQVERAFASIRDKVTVLRMTRKDNTAKTSSRLRLPDTPDEAGPAGIYFGNNLYQ